MTLTVVDPFALYPAKLLVVKSVAATSPDVVSSSIEWSLSRSAVTSIPASQVVMTHLLHRYVDGGGQTEPLPGRVGFGHAVDAADNGHRLRRRGAADAGHAHDLASGADIERQVLRVLAWCRTHLQVRPADADRQRVRVVGGQDRAHADLPGRRQ